MRTVPVAELGEGDVLVRALYMSLDPYMRGRMDDAKSYAACFSLNEPMQARVVGQVVRFENGAFAAGQLVIGMLDWADFSVVAGAKGLRVIDDQTVPLPYYLGALGMPGMTAWIGMEIGASKPGETVFVSAASGAVGQIAGQIGRLKGCHVVGSAGSDDKVNFITSALGFDAGINHRTQSDLLAALRETAPNGLDVYFDNVGGRTLEAALDHANIGARIVVCGMISQYNLTHEETPGVRNLTHINRKRMRMEGFIVSDHVHRFDEFAAEMAGWLKSGAVKYRVDVTDGLENAPAAFLSMLEGGNFGKQVVQIGSKV